MSNLLPVSVVIPVHNNEDTLLRALESTKGCAEVIIICDACTDNSLKVAKSFQTEAAVKIKLVDYKDPGPSRFLGVELAEFEYVCFLDADDEFLSAKLQKQFNFMISRDLKWTCTAYNVLKGDKIAYTVSPPDVIASRELWRVCDIGMSTVMVQKKIFEFQPDFPKRPLEDWKLWLRLAETETCNCLDIMYNHKICIYF